MALKGKAKIIQSPHAKTQYITVPSAVVRDSQYPFTEDEEVEIIVDPDRKLIVVAGKDSSIEISGNKIRIIGKGKK